MSLRTLFAPAGSGGIDRELVFNDLCQALLNDSHFDIQRLYELNYSDFCEALEALKEWRTQRFLYQKKP